MPVGAFVPSELEFDYPRWTAPAIGSTDTGKAWAWNHATGKYEPTTFLLRSAVSAYGLTLIDDADAATARTTLGLGTMATASVPGSTTQVISNQAGVLTGDAGMTYDASTDRLTVAGGLVEPGMRPASDGTSALGWFDASGTQFVYGDTTGRRIGINVVPNAAVAHIRGLGNTYSSSEMALKIDNSSAVRIVSVTNDGRFFIGSQNGNNVTLSVDKAGAHTSGAICRFADATGAVQIYSNQLVTNATSFTIGANGYGSAFNFAPTDNFLLNIIGKLVGVGKDNSSPTAILDVLGSTTTNASLRVRAGTAPTSPNAGDIWFDGTHFYGYNGSTTVQLDN